MSAVTKEMDATSDTARHDRYASSDSRTGNRGSELGGPLPVSTGVGVETVLGEEVCAVERGRRDVQYHGPAVG